MYTIDLAFKIVPNIETVKMRIKNLANNFECEHHYITHEHYLEKGTKNGNIKYIMTIMFSTDKIDEVIGFLKTINRVNNIYIEAIYNNKLLYASSVYKKNLPKRRPTANNINTDEQLIIDLMKK